MKKHIQTCATLLILLLFMQFTSACTAIGYFIGNAADKANTEIEYKEISTLEPYTEINITFISGGTKYGTFKNVVNDTLNLYDGKPEPMGNIQYANLINAPKKYQYIGMAIGVVIDIAYIIYMVIELSEKKIPWYKK